MWNEPTFSGASCFRFVVGDTSTKDSSGDHESLIRNLLMLLAETCDT